MPSVALGNRPVFEPVIKICGLKSADQALAAHRAGATALGLNFAPSKRRITIEEGNAIASALPMGRPTLAGVFVNADIATLETTARAVGLDVLQLSGDEDPAVLTTLSEYRIWKALRFAPSTTLDDARSAVDRWLDMPHPVEVVLIDAAVQGAYGGTGHRADWDLVATLAVDYPVVLAGGLNPANVGSAIEQTHPLGVDVASGVERDGVKDAALIEAFVVAARVAYAGSDASRSRSSGADDGRSP